MFGMKERHQEMMNRFKQLDGLLEDICFRQHSLETLIEALEITSIKDMIEINKENLNRLNMMILEVKGVVAMANSLRPSQEKKKDTKK